MKRKPFHHLESDSMLDSGLTHHFHLSKIAPFKGSASRSLCH